MRGTIFANGEIYHIYNLGVERRPVFTNKRDYDRALLTMNFYRFKKVSPSLGKVLNLDSKRRNFFWSQLFNKGEKAVDILGYCLMPNHFHFLLRQLLDDGIVNFISNFSNSYTRYFNEKNKRIGPLSQGAFKAVRIEDNEQFIHVLRYIHINPVVSSVIKEEDLENYPYCSLSEYLGKREGFCNKELAEGHFSSIDQLKNFTFNQIDYGKRLERIKHLVLE